VCITTNQPDTKSNPNPITKQHIVVSIELNIVVSPTYPAKFIRDSVIAPFFTTFRCHRHTELFRMSAYHWNRNKTQKPRITRFPEISEKWRPWQYTERAPHGPGKANQKFLIRNSNGELRTRHSYATDDTYTAAVGLTGFLPAVGQVWCHPHSHAHTSHMHTIKQLQMQKKCALANSKKIYQDVHIRACKRHKTVQKTPTNWNRVDNFRRVRSNGQNTAQKNNYNDAVDRNRRQMSL